MWIKKQKVQALSHNIREIIDGKTIDIRENTEGEWAILKNDIHTLASLKAERAAALETERDNMRQTLANISHQLKTPLTSMMLMADLLEDAPPAKQGEFIANIKTGLNRMEWLVAALLKMAKLEAGTVAFTKENIPAQTLVTQALAPLQPLIEGKKQRVDTLLDATFFADRPWTVEALSNILKNAIEHTPEGGIIYVNTGHNPICSWVQVQDSGSGIPKEKLPQLFKPFESSQNEKGHGIGLALAQAIMRGQGGDVQVDIGGNGRGATFALKWY